MKSEQLPSYQKSDSMSVEEGPLSPTSSLEESTSETSPVGSTRRDSSTSRRRSSIVDVIYRAFSITREGDSESFFSESDDGTPSNHRPLWSLFVGVTVALVVALGFILHTPVFGETTEKSAIQAQDGKTCAAEDPVMALKSSSALDDLQNGAVAADHPLCSKMGTDILKSGGNAVDAAVTVGLCLGVANPASSGLGGGAFMLTYTAPTSKNAEDLPDFVDARSSSQKEHKFKNGKVCEVFDSREVAPNAAFTEMYDGKPDGAAITGGLAIPVPGELKGWELAHARHGTLSWSRLVDPVVKLSQNGVPVNQNLAYEIQNLANFSKNTYLRKILTKDDTWDNPLREGELMFNDQLTKTLIAVRDEGSKALYTGTTAENLAADVQSIGGILSKEDLEGFRATLRSPVVGRGISGVSLVGVPPPSSGGAVIIGAARFLSGFKSPLAMYSDGLSVHRRVEALKHAFAIRMSLSDPDFNTEVVSDAVDDLVATDYMEQLRRLHMDNSTLPISQYGGVKWAQLHDGDGEKDPSDAHEGDRRLNGPRFGYLNDHGTSHFSIVDKEGNAVAVTTSVNTYFGSSFVSPSTGIVLSSTMGDFGNPGEPDYFGLKPSEANFIKPGKKPLSSMSPTMVFQEPEGSNDIGKLMLVAGGSGGPKIISAVMALIANHYFLGMPLFEAVISPRVHDQLIYHGSASATIENAILEQGPSIVFPNRTRSALEKRGHRLVEIDYEGTLQAIAVDPETNSLNAVCDVRKGGHPSGF